MAKRKVTPLAQAIALINQLDANEQQTVADLIRLQLQPVKKRPTSVPKASTTSSALAKQLRQVTGASVENCKAVLDETGGDFGTAEQLLRARGQASIAKEQPE